MVDPGIYYNFPEDDYHALNSELKKGDEDWVLSRSDLAAILRCPAEWFANVTVSQSESMKIGSALDCMLLTPDEFDSRYENCPDTYEAPASAKKDAPIVQKPWNRNATYCEKWEESKAEQGIELLSGSQQEKLEKMSENIRDLYIHEFGVYGDEFISSAETQVLAISEYEDEDSGRKIKLRALIDILPAAQNAWLWDLKTSAKLDPVRWAGHVSDYAYDIQGAMYLDVFNRASGESRTKFGHLAVGNTYPYLTAPRYLSERYLELGRMKMRAAIRSYCRCLDQHDFYGWCPEGLEPTQPNEWEYSKWRGVAHG